MLREIGGRVAHANLTVKMPLVASRRPATRWTACESPSTNNERSRWLLSAAVGVRHAVICCRLRPGLKHSLSRKTEFAHCVPNCQYGSGTSEKHGGRDTLMEVDGRAPGGVCRSSPGVSTHTH
eukprot:50979-Pleurochrysis_carterae.AAC.1